MLVQSVEMKAALAAGRIHALSFVRADLPSGSWAFTDGDADATLGGQAYIALGEAFSFALPAITTQRRPEPATVSLSAASTAALAGVFEDDVVGHDATLGFLILDPETGAPVGEYIAWRGKLDAPELADAAQDPDPTKVSVSTLQMAVTAQGDQMNRPGVRTRSDADQRAHRDPDDGFFKAVGVGLKAEIYWGQESPRSPSTLTTRSVSPQRRVFDILTGGRLADS